MLDWLIEDYSDASKGIGVIKLGDGYIMAIKKDYLPYVEKLYRPQMNNLSMAALETDVYKRQSMDRLMMFLH